MNLSERMLAFENKVIDFLTIFTWWTEVRFDKNNIYLSLVMSTWQSLFFALMFVGDIPELLDKKRYAILAILSMCTFLCSCVFLFKIFAKNFLLTILKSQNPQGTPNPCRIRARNSLRRRLSITFLVFGFYYVTIDSGVSDIFFYRHQSVAF